MLVQAYQRREAALAEHLEVHVAGMCYRRLQGTWFVLLQRRARDRELFPGLLEGCGGRLRPRESFRDGVFRHFATELGVKVLVLSTHEFYEIPCSDGPIPGIRFLCLFETEVEKGTLVTESEWYLKDAVVGMVDEDFIPGVKQVVLAWFDELSRNGAHG